MVNASGPMTLVDKVPDVRKSLPIGSVPMGDLDNFTEYQLDLGMADGPFKANWESIETNYPGTPEWLRDAKFGIWVHFGPQSAGQSGDWEDYKAYANHLKNFGHPSKVGYKDVLRDWSPDSLNPEYLTDLYHKAGARFLMIQGVHHDNYDLWNSKYQPWNSVNIREAPVGDWFYAPGFTYDSGMMIKFIIESIARDGNAALNICLLPDGSIDPDCVKMLEEVGDWMARNGEAVYGSRAWHTLGEGVEKDGKLRKLPGGGLGKRHAEFQFSPEDFRFTRGKNGSLYAFCMTVPEGGRDLMIKSLANGAKEAPEIKDVKLLGYESPLKWTQTDTGLSVTLPSDLSDFKSALVFRID